VTAFAHDLPAIQQALLAWHRDHSFAAPWRESRNPYHALVAAFMAQQTQMSRVLPAFERFVAAFPSLEALAAASAGDVIRAWAGIGYNTRAVRLHRAARTIAALDEWPREASELERIDGVGPFTAAIVASFAFGVPAACVDTNVRRVLGRLSGDEPVRRVREQKLAASAIVTDDPARWNQALMDYGAAICRPKPKCEACVVALWCASSARYAGRAVQEERARYDARPRKREAPYQGSSRFYRGRIVALLRETPAGARLPLTTLPAIIANGRGAPSLDETRALVRGLERDGLVTLDADCVALPE
jgi:A/G-specific adenine glycosylase